MKLRIKIPMIDKITGEKYEAGEVREFDGARGAELLADPRKMAELVQEEVIVQEEVETKKDRKKR